jgi:tetratricopeptide (TPR) repeat protein
MEKQKKNGNSMIPQIDSKSKAAAFVNAAVNLQQVGEFERAILLLRDACQIAPNYVPAHISFGLACQATSQPREAEAAFRKAIELEPENPQALKAFGLFLGSQLRLSESLVWLKKYCDINQSDNEMLDAFVNALISLGRLEEAESAFQKAWQNTQDPDVGLRYTRYLFAHNKPVEARKIIEQVCKIKETPPILAELALSQVIEGQPASAVQTLQRAIKIDENYDRAWRGLAQCHTQLGQPSDAMDAAEHALAINPRHYRNWQAKADALIASEKFEDALLAINAGMELIASDDEEAQPVLAVLYLQQFRVSLNLGRLNEGLDVLTQGRRQFPKDERFYETAVQIYQQINRPQDALDVLDEIQQTDSSTRDRLIPIRYMLLHQLGKPDEAWSLVKDQFKKRKQTRLDMLAGAGVQLYTSGHYQSAQRVFEQLSKIAPDDIRLRTNLGYLLIGEKDLEKAEAHFKYVIEKAPKDDFGLIAHCNLGFVRILQNRLDEARKEFENVLQTASTEKKAILRVAFFWKGHIIPDYSPHPSRSIELYHAAQANLIAISLAEGDLKQAQERFDALENSCSDLLKGQVLACILAASSKSTGAKKTLKQALDLAQHPAEKQMINTWLTGSGK